MNITKGRVLVKIVKGAPQKIGALTVPDTSDSEGIEKGVVVKCDDPEIPCKAGDNIIIYKGAGKEFTNPVTLEKNRLVSSNEVILIYQDGLGRN